MWAGRAQRLPQGREGGQAALLVLGLLGVVLAGALIVFGFGQALGARGKHQRAADLAAISAAQVMRRNYTRLFQAAWFENGLPNPRHLSNAAYLALARAAALHGARRNGVAPRRVSVSFPGAGFAPTRVAVAVRGAVRIALPTGGRSRGGRSRAARRRVAVRARAAAEIAPDLGASLGMPTHGSGGGYDGPLAYRMGKPMRSPPEPALTAGSGRTLSPVCPGTPRVCAGSRGTPCRDCLWTAPDPPGSVGLLVGLSG